MPWQTNPGFNTFQSVKLKESTQNRRETNRRNEKIHENRPIREIEDQIPIQKPQKSSKIPLLIIVVASLIIAVLVKSLFISDKSD